MIQIKLNDSNLFLINPYKNISNFQLIQYIPIQLIFSIISKLTPYNPNANFNKNIPIQLSNQHLYINPFIGFVVGFVWFLVLILMLIYS